MKRTASFAVLVLAVALAPGGLRGQDVVWHPQPEAPLAQKWQWAADQAGDVDRGYWIGYSVERLMGEHSFVGSWSSRGRRTTLHELLYGEEPDFVPGDRRRGEKSDRKVIKEVALLFEFAPGAVEVGAVRVTDVAGHVDLKGRPLLWLGGAADGESLDLAQRQYRQARSDDAREDLVTAIALHDATDRVVSLLAGVLSGDDIPDVRKSAAFWLGQQDDARALDLLRQTARDDRAAEVRKQAVFAISQMDLPEATDALIELARQGQGTVRKEAIFWLGQKASDRAVEALGEMVHDDTDTEVQKQAVFALSQLPDDQGVPMLIEIARTHAKAEVRKQAIFWLGQSDDPRALDALIELAKG